MMRLGHVAVAGALLAFCSGVTQALAFLAAQKCHGTALSTLDWPRGPFTLTCTGECPGPNLSGSCKPRAFRLNPQIPACGCDQGPVATGQVQCMIFNDERDLPIGAQRIVCDNDLCKVICHKETEVTNNPGIPSTRSATITCHCPKGREGTPVD